MAQRTDLAIIGAGILGLAHAVAAIRAGMSVTIFDRSPRANGASVRNFGMLALVAQATGPNLNRSNHSLEIWQDVASQAALPLERKGCLFLAREPEELRVLEEFKSLSNAHRRETRLISQKNLPEHAPGLNIDNTIGALWSPDAWKVDQRQSADLIAGWLQQKHGVAIHFSTEVLAVESQQIVTATETYRANHILVCAGDEFSTLFPDTFDKAGVSRCQLQMLRTVAQPSGWELKPFVVGGLSLPRYAAFSECPSLPELREMQKEKFPQHLENGIHVILAQEADGSITIGDSHTYGVEPHVERSQEIDQLITDEFSDMLSAPNPQIAERWLGHYAHLSTSDVLRLSPIKGVTAITMTNGQGMTHGFAVAEDTIAELASS